MANRADPDEAKSPWTIKGVRASTRKLATDSAIKQDLTVAEWHDRAVRNQANLEAGDRVLPPSRVGTELSIFPASHEAAKMDMAALEPLAQLARLARELTPEGKDSGAMRDARRVIRRYFAILDGQTKAANGQTEA